MTMLESLIVASVFGLAGLFVFVYGYNRYIVGEHSGVAKHLVPPAVLIVLVVIPTGLGWWTGFSWLLGLPAGVFVFFLLGEVQRLAIRRRCRAAPPVKVERPHLAGRRPITTIDLVIAYYRIEAPGWSGRRLRVAHLSDLHLNGALPMAYYFGLMEQVNRTHADLVVLTGDFVSDLTFKDHLPELLAHLAPRHASLATLGNHDYWIGPEPIADRVVSSGVLLIQNQVRCLELPGVGPVAVLGCDLPWYTANWNQIRPEPGQLLLAMSHTPDNVYRIASTGAVAMFSGHLHAGQFRLPWLGPVVVPSIYGRRFDHGHFEVAGVHLFVTAGVGVSGPALRLRCHPDLFIVDIVGAGG